VFQYCVAEWIKLDAGRGEQNISASADTDNGYVANGQTLSFDNKAPANGGYVSWRGLGRSFEWWAYEYICCAPTCAQNYALGTGYRGDKTFLQKSLSPLYPLPNA